MKALVIGATGATGKVLVEKLLEDERFSSVLIFVRRKTDWQHDKLIEHMIDFGQWEEYQNLINADVLFSCLGTTLKDAGSKDAQWKIDYKYQFKFAQIAKNNGINRYVLVSSAHANSHSKIFYSRMKGQLEDDVKKLNFEQCIIFNPPALIRENSSRKLEKLGVNFFLILNKFGLAKDYKPLHTKDLAQAMINAIFKLPNGEYNLQPKEIRKYF